MTDAVEIVSDLVKIPSVSPFGRNETERRERFERCREVLAYLEEFLQKQGAQTEQLVFEGGHDKWWYPVPNLYAELTIGDRKAAGHKFFYVIWGISTLFRLAKKSSGVGRLFPDRLTKVSSGGGAQRT